MFSRFPVAWMVAEHENSALAKQLFAEALTRYKLEPGRITMHNDCGAPMTAVGFIDVLAALGVQRSLSRPRVSSSAACPSLLASDNVSSTPHTTCTPERFVRGRPAVRLPPEKVTIDPIDPGAPLQTAAELLNASASTPTPFVATPPVPALPGLAHAGESMPAVCS